MAKRTHANYSESYLKENPMPELNAATVERLAKMMSITGHGLTLSGHSWLYNARYLFLKGYLKLESVEDLRRVSYGRPSEIDLEDSDSIRTYDELAEVRITSDLQVQIHVDESTVSLRAQPSRRRAVFHLTGDWWRLWHYSTTVESLMTKQFTEYAEGCRHLEEIAQKLKRRREIEDQLLAGTYEFHEVADGV